MLFLQELEHPLTLSSYYKECYLILTQTINLSLENTKIGTHNIQYP